MQDRGADATVDAGLPGRWIAMGAILIASFMNLIDVTIVNVAIPSLQSAFAATDSQIEWVVAVYILTFALLLLPMGRLGDVIGRRRMFIAGIVVFTVASALCGLAGSVTGLVVSRVLQGVGGAMMIPQTLALVPVLFPPHERGKAFALFGISAGLASVTGPILGGTLIGADLFGLGWRPIFLVNVPFGILAVLATLRYVPNLAGARELRLDFGGVALAALALLLFLFPLIEGRQIGWPWWCFAMMAAALPVAWAFLRWERARAAAGAAQLLPASLLGNRNYMIGCGLVMLQFGGMPGLFFTLAITLQVGYGLSALDSGLTTVPFPVGVMLASTLSGRLGSRWPRERIAVGGVLLALGMIALRFGVPVGGADLSRWALMPGLLIAGLGLGTAVSPLFQTVLSNVEGRDTGSASGAVQAFQQVGGALGLAVVGEMFFSRAMGLVRTGTPQAEAFADGLRFALLAVIVVFGALAAFVWRLPAPKPVAGRPGAAPVMAE